MKNILVADDDPTIRALINDCLTSLGYNVFATDSGTSCLEQLKITTPDILILDMLMPDMNGIEVMSKIRLSANQSKLPIILLSADSQTAAKTVPTDTANIFMQKPFALKELLTAIESFVVHV